MVLTTLLSIGQFLIERYYARGKRGDSGPGQGLWQITRGNLPVFGRTRSDLAGLASPAHWHEQAQRRDGLAGVAAAGADPRTA